MLSLLIVAFFEIDINFYLPYLFLLLAIYLTYRYHHHNQPKPRPTSYPGGPRPNRGTYSVPKWSTKTKRPHHSIEPGWEYVEATESHTATEKRFQTITTNNSIRLTGESAGRQTWQFNPNQDNNQDNNNKTNKTPPPTFPFDPSNNPNSSDLLYRYQQINRSRPQNQQSYSTATNQNVLPKSATHTQKKAGQAAHLGTHFYSKLQCNDGHWGGDYGGPMFLMPGVVVVAYVTGTMDSLLPAPHRRAMITYLRNHQQEDGGWGTHIESPSTMFGSTLSYVTLRLLGVSAQDKDMIHARTFMSKHGGALYTSSWAKFWLAVLGCYEWDGINSIPPEMWLLPNWCPFHPGKMWCHSRMVYLPMCYIYGKRWVYPKANSDPLILELRQELYATSNSGTTPYNEIKFTNYRHAVADIDNYSPITWFMKTAHNVLTWYEWLGGCRCIRKRGLDFAIDYIRAEDIQTNYINIGPVNKTMNMLVSYIIYIRMIRMK